MILTLLVWPLLNLCLNMLSDIDTACVAIALALCLKMWSDIDAACVAIA